jgi:hypothetical protein
VDLGEPREIARRAPTDLDLTAHLPTPVVVGTIGKGDVGQVVRPSKELAPVQTTLYFVSRMGELPLPDVVTLKAVGREPVWIRSVALKDDPGSPFGVEAAQHYTWYFSEGDFSIRPGYPAQIEVRYLADVVGMQSAILEVRTDAENLPRIRVALYGKVIEL